MLYCGLFTSVHLLDIIVVVVITKLFFQYIDPSVYLSTIAQISAVLVISIGMYLLWHSIRKYYRRREEDARSSLQKKNHIIMAIITGLTPCAF